MSFRMSANEEETYLYKNELALLAQISSLTFQVQDDRCVDYFGRDTGKHYLERAAMIKSKIMSFRMSANEEETYLYKNELALLAQISSLTFQVQDDIGK